MAEQRWALVQAMRGVAASWVVLFHAAEGGHIPGIVAALGPVSPIVFGLGYCGVAIFFCLSGFVLAHSLRAVEPTLGNLGRFALRRSIRLDPPYWVSMVVVVALGALSARVAGEAFALPSIGQVLAHVFYVQELLGVPAISSVYWTLTYEVQFYLVLFVLLAAAARLRWSPVILLMIPFAVEVATAASLVPEVRGLFVNYWYAFLLGVLAYRASSTMDWVLLAAVAVISLVMDPSPFTVTTVVSAFVLLAAKTRRWMDAGNWRWLQCLGLVSYSLYLTHNQITGAAFNVMRRLSLPEWVALPAAILACVLFAAILWWLVERPSMELARSLTRYSPGQARAPAA